MSSHSLLFENVTKISNPFQGSVFLFFLPPEIFRRQRKIHKSPLLFFSIEISNFANGIFHGDLILLIRHFLSFLYFIQFCKEKGVKLANTPALHCPVFQKPLSRGWTFNTFFQLRFYYKYDTIRNILILRKHIFPYIHTL